MHTRPVTPSIQPFGNPRYWLDPENGRRIAEALAHKLGELRPNDASNFDDRFQAFSKRLLQAEDIWNAEMRPYHGRKEVTYYRSWSNFLKYFQLVSVGELEPQPGIPPSRDHTSELVNLMKSQKVGIILERFHRELCARALLMHTRLQVLLTKPDFHLSREAEEAVRFAYERSQEIQALAEEKLPPQGSS